MVSQKVAGSMKEAQARKAGYISTQEVFEYLDGKLASPYNLRDVLRTEGLVPMRVSHAYWWKASEVAAWADGRQWRRPAGAPPVACKEPGCKHDALVHGVCMMHYKRTYIRKSKPSRAGKPVGAGVYGRVDEDNRGRLICHECGKSYINLASHVRLSHGMSAAEYREVYEIPRGVPLMAKQLTELRSVLARKPERLERLAAVRDPQAASAARGKDVFEAVGRSHRARSDLQMRQE